MLMDRNWKANEEHGLKVARKHIKDFTLSALMVCFIYHTLITSIGLSVRYNSKWIEAEHTKADYSLRQSDEASAWHSVHWVIVSWYIHIFTGTSLFVTTCPGICTALISTAYVFLGKSTCVTSICLNIRIFTIYGAALDLDIFGVFLTFKYNLRFWFFCIVRSWW